VSVTNTVGSVVGSGVFEGASVSVGAGVGVGSDVLVGATLGLGGIVSASVADAKGDGAVTVGAIVSAPEVSGCGEAWGALEHPAMRRVTTSAKPANLNRRTGDFCVLKKGFVCFIMNLILTWMVTKCLYTEFDYFHNLITHDIWRLWLNFITVSCVICHIKGKLPPILPRLADGYYCINLRLPFRYAWMTSIPSDR
jgi:hypothetical protein